MQREIHKKFRLSDFKYVTFAINLSQSYGMINNNEARANTNKTYCGGREKKQKNALNSEQ